MKKGYSFCLLCMMLLLASCSKNEYVNSLPKETKLVLSVNLANLSQKAGLEDESLQNELKRRLDASGDTAQAGFWKSLLTNPKQTGFDLKQSCYFYMTENDMGAVAAVDDKDNMTDFFRRLLQKHEVEKVEEDGDYTWVVAPNVLIAFTDDRFLATSTYGDDGVFRQKMKKLMEQDADRSFSQSEAFKKLNKMKGDVTMYASYGVIPSSYVKQWKMLLPADLEPSDLEGVVSLNFENGRAVATAELFSSVAATQKQITQLSAKMKKLSGAYGECVPTGFLAFASVSCTKSMMTDLLKNNKEVGLALALFDRALPVTQLLTSVEGDVSVCAVPGADFASASYMAYARLANQDFMKESGSWVKDCAQMGIKLIPRGGNTYAIRSGQVNYQFGVKNDYFYFSNDAVLAQQAGETYKNKVMQPWLSHLKDSYAFGLVNLAQFQLGLQQDNRLNLFGVGALRELDVLVLRLVEPTKMELILTSKQQKENILKLMIQECMK